MSFDSRYPWAEPFYYSQNPSYPDPYNYEVGALMPSHPLPLGSSSGASIGAGERISQPRSSNPAEGTPFDWSTVAKVGIVVGGVLAAYLIYRMSSSAAPIAERMGRAGGKILATRYGGSIRSSSAAKMLSA